MHLVATASAWFREVKFCMECDYLVLEVSNKSQWAAIYINGQWTEVAPTGKVHDDRFIFRYYKSLLSTPVNNRVERWLNGGHQIGYVSTIDPYCAIVGEEAAWGTELWGHVVNHDCGQRTLHGRMPFSSEKTFDSHPRISSLQHPAANTI